MIGVDPLSHDCRTNYPAYHHDGERFPSSIKYIVVHATESDSAKSSAEYFMQPGSGGSANLVVDWRACYRCLGDNVIPWGAPPLNVHGFHIEHAGYAKWSRAQWLSPLNRRTLQRGAYKAAVRCKWYGIPARMLTASDLEKDYGVEFDGNWQAGPMRGGIVEHRTINQVYHESDHTCPGAGFPTDVYVSMVEGFLAKL